MKPVRVENQKGYLVDGTMYRTKKELTDAVRAILSAYEAGARVTQRHFDFLLSLLSYRPEADEKVGVGVAAFEVRPVPGYEHVSSFWAIRQDGTEVSWSYTKVINGSRKPMARFRKACRAAIADQLLDFKLRWFKEHAKGGYFTCPFTGERVAAERAHVDHVPPLTLDALVRAFIKARGLEINSIGSQESLPENAETGIGRVFADASLSEDWQAYHRKHAKLRVVSDTANLSHVKKLSGRRAG